MVVVKLLLDKSSISSKINTFTAQHQQEIIFVLTFSFLPPDF